MRKVWAAAAAALAISAAGVAIAQVPGPISAALKDASRPETDVSRDAARKPGELLAWSNVRPGQKVADLIMGGGYFTRILSAAVGPKGHVYAYQPEEFVRFQKSYGESQDKVAAAYKNVTPIRSSLGALDLPDGLDLVITVQNYHDLHLKAFPQDTATKVNSEIFKSLKPGGLYVIVDHVANEGAGLAAADGVHRIEPSIVRREVEAAGFRFEGESPLLRVTSDPHTTNVFDPSIRGKTDQFALKFRKPR
jgi:predicted methyltransferase